MEKTIISSVLNLTLRKKQLLDNDYYNYQWWMIFGIDKGLLSYQKQKKHFKQEIIKYKEYPLPLDSRFIRNWLRKKNTKLTQDWIKIPNSQLKGQGLWLPLKFHQPIPENGIINDSYLVLKKNQYYIHFNIDIIEPNLIKPQNIIGIDLGLKNPVTLTNLKNKKTSFLGKEINQIRGKSFYLRRKLGQSKKLNIIKKISYQEKRKVDTLLHELSKAIVNQAYLTKSAIIIGKLENLQKNKGRKFNRKLNNFPHYKLTKYIEYKAKERGVPTILVNEAYTSKTCSVCGTIGQRIKNWFKCNNCDYKDNADRNASINIGKRGLNYMLGSGVVASALKSLDKCEGISIKTKVNNKLVALI